MDENSIYIGVPYAEAPYDLESGRLVNSSFRNPILTSSNNSRGQISTLPLDILERVIDKFRELRKNNIDEDQDDNSVNNGQKNQTKPELSTNKFVDITNFITAYNNFMIEVDKINNLVREYLNKKFNIKLDRNIYHPIIPKITLFPYNDDLKRFEKNMKERVRAALVGLLPLFNKIDLKMVNINKILDKNL
jgi:hypothetical protein